jgi:hypothetical protein
LPRVLIERERGEGRLERQRGKGKVSFFTKKIFEKKIKLTLANFFL